MGIGCNQAENIETDSVVTFHIFFELSQHGYGSLLLFEFEHDKETDWYEARVFHGEDLVGFLHGYANVGWNPQVNNVWVTEKYRRRGIASVMMTKVERYFGQTPLPATRIEDNKAAREFWKKFLRWAKKSGTLRSARKAT
ncbi:GNAT family N-acetyltransferase [Thermodesulfobacteriota bacterium]